MSRGCADAGESGPAVTRCACIGGSNPSTLTSTPVARRGRLAGRLWSLILVVRAKPPAPGSGAGSVGPWVARAIGTATDMGVDMGMKDSMGDMAGKAKDALK